MPKLDDLMDFEGEENVYEVEKIVGVHRQPVKFLPTLPFLNFVVLVMCIL